MKKRELKTWFPCEKRPLPYLFGLILTGFILATNMSFAQPTGEILREYWTGITGTTISDLSSSADFPDNPTGSDMLSSFEAVDWNNTSDNDTWADSYGQRIIGYIHPPQDGMYTFYVSGDDNCELYLSSGSSSTDASLIASVSGWTNLHEWGKYSEQTSTPVYLESGNKYYVEAIHKEGAGGDRLSVGWTGPGISSITVIQGQYLSSYSGEIVSEGPIYQAENAIVTGAIITETYVDFTEAGQTIEFQGINHPTGGQVTMTMRYANGRTYSSGTDLFVNGTLSGTLWDSPTGGWEVFADKTINITLNAGSNTIRLISKYDHSPNIDYIDVPGTTSAGTPITYTLDVAGTNGSINKSPDLTEYEEGTNVTITATPEAGYQFDGWSGDASGTTNPLTVLMDADKNIAASFSLIPQDLPTPWLNQDIGSVAASGDATYSAGVFTVDGSGNDIWNTADEFHYVYQTLNGDGEIIAQVTSQTNTNGWAKAGVMIRESLANNSTHASMVLTPANGVSFQRRITTGGTSSSTTTTGSLPGWVKIERVDDAFNAYSSTDGTTWTQVGSSQTITMGTDVYIGLAVTSHSDGSLSTSTFDNVAVSTSTTPDPDTTLTYDIGMNLGGITDYAESKPFADAMKQHRRWTRIGGVTGECDLDANYWPTEDAECLLYHGLTTENNHGIYSLSYDGQPVTVECNAASITDVVYDDATNRTNCTFQITDQNNSWLNLKFTNTNNGVQNVKVMRPLSPGSTTPHPESTLYYKGFKQALAPFSILRAMDFTSTNHNEDRYWSDRTLWTHSSQSPPEPDGKDYGWQGRGASWEAIIMLANELNKDIWICVPHMADDNYIQNLATLFRDGNEHTPPLNANLKLYVEYSNEVWNWAGAFSQTPYAKDMGNSYGHPITFDGGPSNDNDALRRFCAMRTVQISLIFRQVFGDSQMMSRVRPVIMTQKGFKDITDFALSFIDRYYSGADARSDWSDPQPVKYFVYGHSGTTYFSPAKNAGVDINSIWNSNEFDGWGVQYPKQAYVSTWSKTFGLKTMAYEGNVHYTYDTQGTDDVIDQAVLDPRWVDELQEQFEVFAASGGDHWSFFGIEGWMPPTHGDIWNTNTDFYQKLVELTNSDKHPVTYGNTVPFNIDGGAVSAITRGWGEPTSGTVTLTAQARLYASMYAMHTNTDGMYNAVIEYSSNTDATLQVMFGGDVILSENVGNTGGNIESTNSVNISLKTGELYVLRTACLNGEIKIHRVIVNSSAKSAKLNSDSDASINNEPVGVGLNIYPNPASEFVTIECSNEDSQFAIFDLNGKLVYSGEITDYREVVPVNKLNPGTYIVFINSNGKQESTSLFVK